MQERLFCLSYMLCACYRDVFNMYAPPTCRLIIIIIIFITTLRFYLCKLCCQALSVIFKTKLCKWLSSTQTNPLNLAYNLPELSALCGERIWHHTPPYISTRVGQAQMKSVFVIS